MVFVWAIVSLFILPLPASLANPLSYGEPPSNYRASKLVNNHPKLTKLNAYRAGVD
jgi:hypothetical protein